MTLSAWKTSNYSSLTALQKAAVDLVLIFGEAITYTPSGGAARSITGVIDYGGIEKTGAIPQGHGQTMNISVFNNATYGITSTEVDTGGDTITLPMRIGGTAQARRITKIIHQDDGMITLEVR